MLLCTVTWPVFHKEDDVVFDGKIGIRLFIKTVVSNNNSINKLASTPETKFINTTEDIYTTWMREKVIPAIKVKFDNRDTTIKRIEV